MGVFEIEWVLDEEGRKMVTCCRTIELIGLDGAYRLGDQFEIEMEGFTTFGEALEEVAKRLLTTKAKRMSGLVLALVNRGAIKVRHITSDGRVILKFPW